MKFLTADQARSEGYHSISYGFRDAEFGMLLKASAQLTHGRVPHCVVDRPTGLEIWRQGGHPALTGRAASQELARLRALADGPTLNCTQEEP